MLAGPRDAGQRVRTCISRSRGKGNHSGERRIILRRRRSRSIPRGTLILFSGPAILLRSRGTPRVETRSWNAYSSRRIFRTTPSSASRRTPSSSNQRRFRFPVSPRVRGARGTGPAFPAAVARSCRYQDSLIKTSIRPA